MQYLRTRNLRDKTVSELQELLEKWWCNAAEEFTPDEGFFVGDSVFYLMAEAAAAVLLAQADVQEYLKREGYMKNG